VKGRERPSPDERARGPRRTLMNLISGEGQQQKKEPPFVSPRSRKFESSEAVRFKPHANVLPPPRWQERRRVGRAQLKPGFGFQHFRSYAGSFSASKCPKPWGRSCGPRVRPSVRGRGIFKASRERKSLGGQGKHFPHDLRPATLPWGLADLQFAQVIPRPAEQILCIYISGEVHEAFKHSTLKAEKN
jgi:hypothetical protein